MVSAVLADYDNFNTLWSGGDTITISFDRAIDQGRQRRSGGKAYVDALFEFDHYLGEDYSGAWVDLSSFVINAIDTSIYRPAVGVTTLRSSSALLNSAATAIGRSRLAPLTGDFGEASAPRFIGFVASDELQVAV